VELLSIVGRTAAAYAVVLVGLRLGGRRELGQLTPFDLVLVLLVANAVQNAMVGANVTLVGGIVAAGTLFLLNAAVARLRLRFPRLRDVVEGRPAVLVRGGRPQLDTIRKQGLTEDEVREFVEEHSGVSDFDDVDVAVLEPTGAISVVTRANRVERTRRTMPKRRVRQRRVG